ncbi:MAG: SGNH/GDSL hydrolase family protein [Lachnospiraceae bacterium]|nr:SGNH/GDSL hydrolase family protein [Lachnospiraceae bacterium]
MKDGMKKFLSSVLFLLILAGLLWGLDLFLRPKTNDAAGGFRDPTAAGVLGEPPGTLDVLFLGDSEVFSSYIPLEIWGECGVCSYALGTPNQELYYSLEWLKEVLKTQQPKLVILETNDAFKPIDFTDQFSITAEHLFPVFRYHDRWKSLQGRDLDWRLSYTSLDPNKGYWYRTRSEAADPGDYMSPTDYKMPLPALNRYYIEQIRKTCEEGGCRLILTGAPCPLYQDRSRHNTLAELCREMNVEYIDMKLMIPELEIRWEEDSLDGGDHLNYAGALKVSRWWSAYFEQSGLFRDKRQDPSYAAWNEALRTFRLSQP